MKIISTVACMLFAVYALAEEPQKPAEEPKTQIAQIAFGGSFVNTRTQGTNYGGFGADVKFSMPTSNLKKTSLGFSLRRVFSSESVQRYDGIAHFDYFFNPYLQAGILGGLQYISENNASASYLKAVLGLQAGARLFSWSRTEWSQSAIWMIADIRSAAGSSGSLLINNGSPNLKSALTSIGLYYSFAIVE